MPASSMIAAKLKRAEDQPDRGNMLAIPPPLNSLSIVALPRVDTKPCAIAL